ncbi:MAG: endonuclease MutS2 [Bacteroidota bacterium]
MSSWDQALGKLEFDKVLQRIVRYAASDPGREAVARTRVRTNATDIRHELAIVSDMKRLLERDEPLPLEGIHNVHEPLARAAVDGMTLQPRELLHILLTLRAARLVRSAVSRRREEFPRIWELAECLHTDKVLEFNIDRAIDETGAVRASASKELLAIRREIADRYEELRKRLAAILRTVSELGFSQDDIITTREGRMVIPVKAEHKLKVPGFIHSASASGATVFIEPTETLELNNEIRGLQFREQREIDKILRDLTVQAGEQKAQLQANLGILSDIDAYQAKAKYSIEILGVEPELTESGAVRLVEARHPLLLATHGRAATVPLDLEVGGSSVTLLISGPNAGGKSVAMKCVGLLTIMAQCGLHVPAREGTRLRAFTSCFVDIGDEQSIENDLSTFSSHLAHLKAIAAEADSHSLVLIDEIGAGTDPSEGGAIAAALLEDLTGRNAVTIATTHQGQLKVFAHETQGVSNGAMEFDQATLTPTYRFRAGVPGSSYALEMASRLGFASALMDRARTILGAEHARLDTLIAELEQATQDVRRQHESLSQEQERLSSLASTYEEKIGKLSADAREMKRRAVEEADAIVARANALIEKSIREIREHHADRDTIRTARREVEDMRREIAAARREVSEPATPTEGMIVPGMSVTVGTGSDAGDVESISPDGKSASVVFGAVRMRVPVADLRPSGGRSPRTQSTVHTEFDLQRPLHQDLDVRGMTGEEATPLIDKFIDDAVLAGLHRIDIIHGKGTGALRKKVTEFLSNHPRVKSFRMAEWNEGGAGATVVELTEGL